MYRDPIIRKYEDLIKANTQVFKRFYQGDPIIPPGASSLPACIIEKTATVAEKLTNASDQQSVQITITIITDVRTELSDDQTLAPGTATLYDLMEGRNADHTLKDTSLLGILRKNITLDQNLHTDLASGTRIDYGPIRQRSKEAWTVEARISFISSFTQIR
jgi:hypothetical protein